MTDTEMKIDPTRLRQLREQRAWSQEQLAEIAGLNVRTVQRVEASGSASLETRMALAAALEVGPDGLAAALVPPPHPLPGEAGSSNRWLIPVLLAAITFVLALGIVQRMGESSGKQNQSRTAKCLSEGRSDCR